MEHTDRLTSTLASLGERPWFVDTADASRILDEFRAQECEIKELEVYAGGQVPDDYSLEMEVEGLRRFASDRGNGRFHLYGYSIGASIALAYAAKHGQQVVSLALDEPATDSPTMIVSPLLRWDTTRLPPCRRMSG